MSCQLTWGQQAISNSGFCAFGPLLAPLARVRQRWHAYSPEDCEPAKPETGCGIPRMPLCGGAAYFNSAAELHESALVVVV